MGIKSRNRMTYPCKPSAIGSSDVIDTDLMYSVSYVHQIGGVNKSRIYPPRPWRMIGLRRGYIAALHTALVYLWQITVGSGGVDLNCVANLVAIHWLREMDLEWDGFRRDITKVVPWEELGNDWSRSYELVLWNEGFEAPGCKGELGKAAGEWRSGVVLCWHAGSAKARKVQRH